ncbi:hypothetical protein CITRIK5_70910 [Citricoccus sp. K5]|nr:hypothetical protein CITRIK5_70910 [Citricoccus sp. K5]
MSHPTKRQRKGTSSLGHLTL